MRKFYFLLILVLSASAVWAKAPELGLSAQMGASFATIDVKLNLLYGKNVKPSIHYLALPVNSAAPDAETILAYTGGAKTAGLSDGTVVRGNWTASSQYIGRVFSLSGSENVRKVPGESGFKDGLSYDIYVLAVKADDEISNIAVAKNIMAMPFDSSTGEGAFVIKNGAQLANIQHLPEADFILGSDIELKGAWKPIEGFRGTLDGCGYSIKNMQISVNDAFPGYWGLFGLLNGAELKNLRIKSASLNLPEGTRLGALAGKIINSHIENIQVEEAHVSGGVYTGGIAGEIWPGTVLDSCRFEGKVSGFGHVGGLIGAAYSAELQGIVIKNCVSQGMVSAYAGGATLGGLAATLTGCTVADSLSLGSPIVSTNAKFSGGFVGRAENSVFKSCVSHKDVKGFSDTGGFAGLFEGEILLVDCHAKGDVYGETAVGGFVGAARGSEISENAKHSIKIVSCRAEGTVEAASSVGGFAGSLKYTAVDACGASGAVNAAGTEAGGFVGTLTHKSRITNSSAYGDVANPKGWQTGGFVGQISHSCGIEYALSTGNVVGFQDTGGFAGKISAKGAPNTLFACLSFAQWISSENGVNRLIGRLDHEGVNNCYAYLGSVVADGKGLRHVQPNAYGVDGADINEQTIDGILTRLGWDQRKGCIIPKIR